ncbi:MAG: transcription elongation factor GreA [Candidatus Nealsonbacteria bacterium]|nr:transcription elongation factor GreA [Candidatus Nealsonbacteria bacterium]
MKKYLTQEGLEKLKKELEYLKDAKRKEIAERLEKCIAFGDLSENSEYHETKEEQAFIEGRILELEDLIHNAVVVAEGKDKMYAQVGSTVLVSSGSKKEEFKIVGIEEANPLAGKISINSPLGKAFLDQPKGAVVEVTTPKGITQYKILKIE